MHPSSQTLAAVAALALTLAAPSPQATARPQPASSIDQLQEVYFGAAFSTDGSNTEHSLELVVDSVDGKEFAGTLDAVENSARAFPLGPPPPPFGFAVSGSVSPKGKFTLTGAPDPGAKLTMKGSLSDAGAMIVGRYTVKEGRTTIEKGIFSLVVDGWWEELAAESAPGSASARSAARLKFPGAAEG